MSTAQVFAVFSFCFCVCSCRYTFISNGMTLEVVSTNSGIVWTLAHEDGVQAILPPVAQHQAVAVCLTQVSMCCCSRLYSLVDKQSIQTCVQAVSSQMEL